MVTHADGDMVTCQLGQFDDDLIRSASRQYYHNMGIVMIPSISRELKALTVEIRPTGSLTNIGRRY